MRILKNNYTVPEKFFVQRIEEQLHSKTIDTFRTRLHNPKSILIEVKKVIKNLDSGKIKDSDHIKHTCNEAVHLIQNESGLNLSRIPVNHFTKLLKNPKKENYSNIIHCIKIYLSDNQSYLDTIISNLITEIEKVNEDYAMYESGAVGSDGKRHGFYLNKIDKWTNFIVTELILLGQTKPRLRQLVYKILIKNHGQFSDAVNNFFSALRAGEINTSVLVRVKIPSEIIIQICDSYPNISVAKPDDFSGPIKNFIENSNRPSFKDTLLIKIRSLDFHYSAQEARSLILSILDFINLGHRESESGYWHHFLVINDETGKHGAIDSNYHLDGVYRSDESLYKLLNLKFQSIVTNNSVDEIVLNVLKSGFRYLRLGDEDIEPEQKLLNYWIGIEHIFSAPNEEIRMINRIAKSFSEIHSLTYFRRNQEYMHRMIIRLGLETKVPSFEKAEISYLNDPSTISTLMSSTLSNNPLATYRLYRLDELIKDKKKFKQHLEKHSTDLVSNFYRIYRVRNEIVHNAAINNSIIEITSHLQYYLLFMLGSIMEFFTNYSIDVNDDKRLNMDDYFIYHRLIFESLEENDIVPSNLIKQNYPLSAHLEFKD